MTQTFVATLVEAGAALALALGVYARWIAPILLAGMAFLHLKAAGLLFGNQRSAWAYPAFIGLALIAQALLRGTSPVMASLAVPPARCERD